MVESMPEIIHKNPEVKKIIEKLKIGELTLNSVPEEPMLAI